jgi:hypothetical protein
MAFVKLGTILNVKDKKTDKMKKTIKLGKEGSNDPKYDFTVELRVTDGNGKVTKFTNPWVNLSNPHENAPKTIVSELQVYIPEN